MGCGYDACRRDGAEAPRRFALAAFTLQTPSRSHKHAAARLTRDHSATNQSDLLHSRLARCRRRAEAICRRDACVPTPDPSARHPAGCRSKAILPTTRRALSDHQRQPMRTPALQTADGSGFSAARGGLRSASTSSGAARQPASLEQMCCFAAGRGAQAVRYPLHAILRAQPRGCQLARRHPAPENMAAVAKARQSPPPLGAARLRHRCMVPDSARHPVCVQRTPASSCWALLRLRLDHSGWRACGRCRRGMASTSLAVPARVCSQPPRPGWFQSALAASTALGQQPPRAPRR